MLYEVITKRPKRENSMTDIFIKNALVMTCEPNVISGRIIENGAVAVSGGKIIAIGKTDVLESEYGNAAKVIDAAGRIVMPGFISYNFV